MKIKPEVIIEVTIASLVALYTGHGISNKANRIAQALEQEVVALHDLDITIQRGHLPRPSLLHRVDIKAIPTPDPEPCQSSEHDIEFTCGHFEAHETKL